MKRLTTGLTLIELMVTLAIVGLLMTATLGVVTNLSRAERVGVRSHQTALLRTKLRPLLARDIGHAGHHSRAAKGFGLRSQAALDPKTMGLRHWGSEVTYEVRTIGPDRWLVRTQKLGDGSTFTELVCTGVRAIALRTSMDSGGASIGRWRQLSEAVTITVDLGGDSEEPIEMTFHTGSSR